MIATALAFAVLVGGAQRPSGELVYTRVVDGTWQVWRRDLASGVDEPLTHTLGDKRYPGWTSDGRVAYQSVNQECWILPRDAKAEPELVLRDLRPVRDVVWSPIGEQLAFTRIRTDVIDAANVCVARLDGHDARWLTDEPGIQYTPCWSPDGKRLAFVTGDGWGSYDLCTIAIDGSERRRIEVPGTHEFLPAWSPDGRTLAFSSDRSGDFEIWTCDVDGGNAKQVTTRPGLDTRPSWSPDGAWIAFTRAVDGVAQIWIMRPDGSEAQALIVAPGGARDAAWRAQPSAPSGAAPQISEVALERKALDLARSETTSIRCRVSKTSTVRVDIVGEDGSVVRRLGGTRVEAGEHSFAWDGHTSDGALVGSGVYRYVIVASDEHNAATVHDASAQAWGEELKPLDFTFEREQGVLRWLMPRAGFARMRIALKNFPLLATLADWQPYEAGRQELRWNGADESGLIELREHPQLWVTLELFAMPDNAIIVRGSTSTPSTPPSGEYAPLVASGPQSFREARKPLREARSPGVDLDFPAATEIDAKGRPIVRGIVPVRVTLADADLSSMTNSLFEAALYVDLNFFFEEEESTSPLTYMWDTTQLQPGPHLLTVNVFSYDGRIGCLTRSVIVGERP